MSALHWNGISATARRQLGSFLGNPLGYVFILAFVLIAGAVMFWIERGSTSFFSRNIADLALWLRDDLFGWMLAVLLPALGMGAWASERDHGTEEHLLTLPLSPFDALLGKWIAVSAFYTVALLCTLAHVGVIAWLGTPDWGLVFANYLGWWLAGLAFAALAILASTLVSLPAVAFVLGVIICCTAQWLFGLVGFYDGFGRGVVGIGAVSIALAVAAAALGAATFVLSSRRWRPGNAGAVIMQVASLCFAIVLLVNLGRIALSRGIDADATSEGLASVSPASTASLKDLKAPVKVIAFISKELPTELAAKGKEVVDKLKALERAAPGQVKIDWRWPEKTTDSESTQAQTEFNLRPRRMPIETASGRRIGEVFLSAVVTSAGRTQVIEHFDPGLSVEYELVRAIRSVSDAKKRVLGIATTDLEMMGGIDFRTMNQSPSWEIVEEWKRQYDVRGVSLDADVSPEIEVLVVPQPSTLTQPQIEKLHDWIWKGGPTLLLEDPLPFFQVVSQGRGDLLPGQPKRNPQQNPYMPAPPSDAPAKGDLRPLLRALGVEFKPDEIFWSEYNPSHYFREMIPPFFMWLTRDRGSIEAADRSGVTTGVNALLLPYPGKVATAKEVPAGISITPLLLPAAGSPWGMNLIMDLSQPSYRGDFQLKRPDEIRRKAAADLGARPIHAVEISGPIASVYPRLPVNALAKKEEGKAEGQDAPKPVVGAQSGKPAHVVLIADLDLIDNEFFRFYRDQGSQFSRQDELRVLLELKNVQFVANAVDALFNDRGYLELRSRRPDRRPLVRLEDVNVKAQEKTRAVVEQKRDEMQSEIDKINAGFQADLAKIDARADLDEETKAHERTRAEIAGQRRVQVSIEGLQRDFQKEEIKLQAEHAAQVEAYIKRVKTLAVAVPAVVLALIALIVFANRLVSERSHIPAARRRQA